MEIPTALCMSRVGQVHGPHDWVFSQSEGGIKDFHYHCPGIMKIQIETYE